MLLLLLLHILYFELLFTIKWMNGFVTTHLFNGIIVAFGDKS